LLFTKFKSKISKSKSIPIFFQLETKKHFYKRGIFFYKRGIFPLMMTDLIKSEPEAFIWAGGIEDTFVPQTRHGHRALDEYELMGTLRALARRSGADARIGLAGSALGRAVV
jgi:hypothetical protein